MGRVFSSAVTGLTARRAQTRKYFAALHITLPIGPGEIQRPVLRVAEAEITLPSFVTIDALIFAAFGGALKRDPDATEYNIWRTALIAALAVSPRQLVTETAARIETLFISAEYTARNTTNDQYVTDLYLAYADRDPEVGGRTFWLNSVEADGRASARLAWAESIEFGDRVRSTNTQQVYRPHVTDLSGIVLSDGAANDDVTLELTNLGDDYSKYLAQGDRLLYPAPTVVMRAYPVGSEGYEADILFHGFARFTNVSRTSAKLTISSEQSRPGVMVGTVEGELCLVLYKGPGCDTNDPTPTCSRLYSDSNGCSSKQPAPILINGHSGNNQPSFYGTARKAAALAGATQVPGRVVEEEFGGRGYIDVEDPRFRHIRGTDIDRPNITA